ncbi:MAG TPA: hypothetical protein VK508_22215 [Cyclobacteriaceae bacterium]|nr:hypothetical protein [Cyclobacteriaceae bacterium]
MSPLLKNLEAKELTDEKIRDFKRVVLAQLGVLISLFLLELFSWLKFALYLELAETIFFLAIGVYAFLLWDMLRNYTSSRRIVVLNFIFIMGVFVAGFICVNPFWPMPLSIPYRTMLVIIQTSLLTVECFVIWFTIREFFKRELGLPIKLWGAAAMYMMIGMSFGSIYEILCVLQLDCLGIEVPLRTIAMMKRVGFSFMILCGIDTPYNITPLISSLTTVEALFSEIFIVLIVGRFLVR